MLVSPMGTSLDLAGTWEPGPTGLIGWRHRSWLGRDNYVKTERSGYLFPLGFPATLVKITERIIQDGLAFQRQRQFIVVRKPAVDYPQQAGNRQPSEGRGQPFKRVTTTTISSPPLDKPNIKTGDFVTVLGMDPDDPTKLKSTELRYQLTFTTKDDRTVTGDLPLIWVTEDDNGNLTQLAADYRNKIDAKLRKLALGGQKVAYVPPVPPADHSLPTTEIVLGALSVPLVANTLSAFPVMDHALVRVEELDALGGPQAAITQLTYEPDIFLANGFGEANGNGGEVWAKLAPPPAQLQAPAAGPIPPDVLKFALSQASGGGMAAPKFAVDALSRVHGTITDVKNVAKNLFDPKAYFEKFQEEGIKLFGAIPLSAVIQTDLLPQLPPTDENIPEVKTVRHGDTVETTVTWNAKLQSFEAPGGLFKFEPAPDGTPDNRLYLTLKLTASRNGQASSVVSGELRNASLIFLDMIGRGSTSSSARPSSSAT